MKNPVNYPLVMFLSIILLSCSSTKKTVSSTSIDVHKVAVIDKDSTAVKTLDSVHLKKDSSSYRIKNDSSFENQVIVEEEFKYIDSAVKLYKRKTTTIQKGKKIYHTSLANMVYDSAHRQVFDSSGVKSRSSLDSSGISKTFHKDVKRVGFSWWWIIFIIILTVCHFALNYFFPGYYKKLFVWIKSKRS